MRYFHYLIFFLVMVSLSSCGGDKKSLNENSATPVIRTDFTDDSLWDEIQKDITATNTMGFSANVRFIERREFSDLSVKEIFQIIPGLSEYGCIFIADTITMTSFEHHLLVIDPSNPEGDAFRVIPSEVWSVENNLSLANMDSADPDCVFRGFK
jgi:hypothetical protein